MKRQRNIRRKQKTSLVQKLQYKDNAKLAAKGLEELLNNLDIILNEPTLERKLFILKDRMNIPNRHMSQRGLTINNVTLGNSYYLSFSPYKNNSNYYFDVDFRLSDHKHNMATMDNRDRGVHPNKRVIVSFRHTITEPTHKVTHYNRFYPPYRIQTSISNFPVDYLCDEKKLRNIITAFINMFKYGSFKYILTETKRQKYIILKESQLRHMIYEEIKKVFLTA